MDNIKYIQNPVLRRKTSPTGIEMIFVQGKPFVSELNEQAVFVLDCLSELKSIEDVFDKIINDYDIDDEKVMKDEVDQIIRRFIAHNILISEEIL